MTNTEADQKIPDKLMGYLKRLLEVNGPHVVNGVQITKGYSLGEIKEAMDEHRLAAFALIDSGLESGEISPDEAQRKKDDWDVRHSYK